MIEKFNIVRYLALLYTIFFATVAVAQDLKVKGIVQSAANEPLAYSAINVHNALDSNKVLVVYTQEDGVFSFEVPSGRYFIDIAVFGVSAKKLLITQSSGDIDLDTIVLKADKSQQLNELIVTADRNQMSLQIDKRVFNVAADLNNQGANATEVLQNIPSVTVDPEGNVSLRGSQNVRILIDGKVSGFATSADALQQLQADMIEKVEIITNASARYEAQGESGIINIVLKKNKKSGFNAALTARTGYFPDNGIGINANYRRNKLNLFGSFNLNHREVQGPSTTRQMLQNEDTAFLYYQGYKHIRSKVGTNTRLGFDYNLNEQNTISASFGLRSGVGNNTIYRTYENYTIQENYLSKQVRDEYNVELEDMYEGSVGYTKKMAKSGAEWKTELRGYRDQDYENSDYTETTSLSNKERLERSKAYITEQSLLLQSDLIIPLSKSSKVESGMRAQVRDFDNEFGYQQLVGTEWQSPTQFNDRFNYSEKVYAAYIMASNTFDKLGVQAGLRAEYSDIFTRQFSLSAGDSRSYFNLFPSLALSYKYSTASTFQLSYSRRINRPGQWDLMPFMKFGDNREIRIGNPDLDPELTGSFEAGMLKTWNTGSLLSSAYYRNTQNKFENMAFLGNDGIIYRKAMNIATRHAYGLEFNLNYNPTNWARIMSGFNFYREVISGNFNNQDFELDNLSWTNRTSINITLPHKWRFQLSGNYEAPRITPQGKRLSMYFADFGASKDIWKNKASLGFNLSDIFNTRKWRSITQTEEIQSETMFQWRQRSFRLVFTYRFNQQKKEGNHENLIENGGGGEQ